MSGGEQQMLTLCRTLMGDPDLVMIDEPTEGLAPKIVELVARLFDEIKSRGVSILLVEQKLTIALRSASGSTSWATARSCSRARRTTCAPTSRAQGVAGGLGPQMSAINRVAVVTGAARGIGLAVARRFLAEDYRVALLDIDAPTLARDGRDGLEPRDRVLAIECDVRRAAPGRERRSTGSRPLSAASTRWSTTPGSPLFKPMLETTFDEWARVHRGQPRPARSSALRPAAPLMLGNGGGAVVNIGSISGLRASTLRVAYGTSKAALMHLTKQQAAELGELGIRVNAVAPGPVDTAMAKQVHTPRHPRRLPRRDPAEPLRDRARRSRRRSAFLCSDAASYVNGQTLAVARLDSTRPASGCRSLRAGR